jgi:hypothetical protein
MPSNGYRGMFKNLSKKKLVPILMGLLLLTGCKAIKCCLTIPADHTGDSISYLVIGVGVITVPKPEKQTAVLATKAEILGINISNQPGLKVGLGYSSSSVVEIPDNAEDVRVEISQKPGGPLKIKSEKAKLYKTSN